MERSAIEALMIGVNAFVFIIALTAAIMLMNNIIDMVNYANQNIYVGMNGSIAENVGELHERTYTGYEILNYYKNIIENKSDANYLVKLSATSNEIELKRYIESSSIIYIHKNFEFKYKGKINNKDTYIFLLKTEVVN